MGFYYKEEVTDERKIYDKNRKEKRTKFWESGDFDKQDKVFAIYFKNGTRNKSETDFSERNNICSYPQEEIALLLLKISAD